MSADREQSALLRQAAPDLHSLTESPLYHFLSNQPQLVTNSPIGVLLCLPQEQSRGYFIGHGTIAGLIHQQAEGG